MVHARPTIGTLNWFTRHWFEIFLLALLSYLLLIKDVHIQIHLGAPSVTAVDSPDPRPRVEATSMSLAPDLSEMVAPAKEEVITVTAADRDAAKLHRNLIFILNPSYAERKQVRQAVVAAKAEYLQQYLDRYIPVAQQEEKQYGVPASITLAQALLESDAGDSRLALESNNHFGIKCKTKCRNCTCRNYVDDDEYDMFRVFDLPKESYREHSLLLQGKRYRHLLELPTSDYRNWAIGLKRAGYATDKNYAQKLIRIIESLELDKYS